MSYDVTKILQELESLTTTLLPDADVVKLKHRYEEIISNYHVERKTPENLSNDFADKVNLYLSARGLEGYSDKTLEGYARELRLFDDFTNKPAIQVSTPDIRKYLSSNEKWQPGTVANKLTIIKAFYKWCVDEEILLRNPANKIQPPKQPKRLPKGFSHSEMEMIRQGCRDSRDRALVEVLYSTGCRISELSSIKTEQIDWHRTCITVIGKGDKERIVYLNARAIFYLKAYLKDRDYADDDCEYLFTTSNRPYRRLSNDAIRNAFKSMQERTWVKGSVYPHRFRHTMATNAMENGIELGDLQQLLGHEKPETTLRYAAVSEERKHQAHKRFIQ